MENLEAIIEGYYELIMAIEKKYPGESGHETALRLIKEGQSFSAFTQKESDDDR